ncbi:hypothetical protein BOX15_Mlig032870g3 [Macrostomum lignano]|uniref:Uncharacterized protein n=1 Tax=Macrostomum lignano TaxID=282301 RepID=A0A267FPP1_9PLAT|nr:hypothetical protein BOX15_Mlig032870g3 [Macrostomum lignano]
MQSFAILLLCLLPGALANLNWDPGMRKQLAAYWNPQSPYFFESCAASSTGRCCNSLNRGFYTLSYDAESNRDTPCKPNTGAVINDPKPVFRPILGERCPFYFYWSNQGFARLTLSMRDWSVQTRSYIGIQENQNTVCSGLPPLRIDPFKIRYLELELRAKVCYRGDRRYAHGHVSHYLTFYNDQERYEHAIRLNIFQFWSAPRGAKPPFYWNLKTFDEQSIDPHPNLRANVWNLHGKLWGFSRYDAWEDPDPGCRSPIENVPWRKFHINVQSLIHGLARDGHVPLSYFRSAKWVGSIVTGVEVWGQASVTVDARNYRLIG